MPEAPSTFAVEQARIRHRREALAVAAPDAPVAGLALSGGGIRSATFAFGVLQALATTETNTPGARTRSLLARFDYLSTVSGGSYIGGFLTSLFVPGRARLLPASAAPPEDAVTAAVRAYDIVACEPPPRIRRKDDYTRLPVGSANTAWLRENGRYLTPTGAGDFLYGAATQVRNWLAMQYVVGTTLLALFSLILLAGLHADALVAPAVAGTGSDPAHAAASAFPFFVAHPLWLLPLAVLFVGVLPAGIAFWLTHPRAPQNDASAPHLFTAATLVAVLIPLAIFAVAWSMRALHPDVASSRETALTAVAVIVVALALVHYALALPGAPTIAAHRVTLTRDLVVCVEIVLTLFVLLAIYTLGQHAYLALRNFRFPEITLAAATGATVWIVRQLATLVDEKATPGWLRALPMNVVALAVALVLWGIVGVLWSAVVQWWAFSGYLQSGDPGTLQALPQHTLFLFVVTVFLAWCTGLFPGFVNLSTLHALYSARLTRAYLGASNGHRFAATAAQRGRSVAEPIEGDQLDVQTFYGPDDRPTLAPVHLLNATLNQTTDPAEQLVQRDRKGRPLALTPAGYTVDGVLHATDRPDDEGETGVCMSVGQWIAVSGAAVSTGLGRATGLGYSLLLGLANIRLGRWWRADVEGTPRARGAGGSGVLLFRSQRLLWDEFTAKFHGTRRRWQYLSDGGHFENTGMYELLRPERDVRLIVACDDGADPAYAFGDLANLIRLVRIDYGLEIEEDAQALQIDGLRDVLLTRDQSAAPTGAATDNRCAVLLNVFRHAGPGEARHLVCRIVVLKPRLIRDLPLDVREYAATHAAFPQESTADQFFDEAQWESYRKLGLAIGRHVLTPELRAYLAL
jgi:hypothetical protein